MLEHLGPQSLTIAMTLDGLEAVESARQWSPNLALMDIAMPGVDGLMAAHRIRQQYGRRVVLIAMSGQHHHLVQARDSGDFDHAMIKPVDVARLLAIIEQAAASFDPR